jgi:hypothetical protein
MKSSRSYNSKAQNDWQQLLGAVRREGFQATSNLTGKVLYNPLVMSAVGQELDNVGLTCHVLSISDLVHLPNVTDIYKFPTLGRSLDYVHFKIPF